MALEQSCKFELCRILLADAPLQLTTVLLVAYPEVAVVRVGAQSERKELIERPLLLLVLMAVAVGIGLELLGDIAARSVPEVEVTLVVTLSVRKLGELDQWHLLAGVRVFSLREALAIGDWCNLLAVA